MCLSILFFYTIITIIIFNTTASFQSFGSEEAHKGLDHNYKQYYFAATRIIITETGETEEKKTNNLHFNDEIITLQEDRFQQIL